PPKETAAVSIGIVVARPGGSLAPVKLIRDERGVLVAEICRALRPPLSPCAETAKDPEPRVDGTVGALVDDGKRHGLGTQRALDQVAVSQRLLEARALQQTGERPVADVAPAHEPAQHLGGKRRRPIRLVPRVLLAVREEANTAEQHEARPRRSVESQLPQ